ncbi:lytic transglycosylase domain-containing protein [Sulfurihydrogenibium subterraneum]|uniref:lytic transglycosylase domain-containing protein n=1 Tax=Sulfurihydrogenibium subterraneum TaxID=171121 RepID=UPI00056200F0|nr:lytic transglycosylase domain-containing protein [Sulfurihydrogenibium subterraneum]
MVKKILLSILFTVFFSYADYDQILDLYKSDFEKIDLDKAYSVINDSKNFALSSYVALKVASFLYYSGNLEKAEKFIDQADKKAFLKEDYPFYLYIYSKVKKDKQALINLATEFTYTYYGYKAYLELYPQLSEEDKEKAVESCIKNRHYEKVKYLIYTLEDQNAINYYLLRLTKDVSYFLSISQDSPYYEKALKLVSSFNKEYENSYINYLIEKNQLDKLKEFLTQRAKGEFYRQNYDLFLMYVELLKSYFQTLSPDLTWLMFLYNYTQGEKDLASYYLDQYKKYSKDPYKILYWESLLNENQLTVPKTQLKVEDITPYLALIYYKNKIKPDILKNRRCSLDTDSIALVIEQLRENEYKLAYIEGNDYIKTNPCERLYSIMPEITVKCFGQNSLCSYVKPFLKVEDKKLENIAYAVIKQESFFDPYAISWSNAVGLTQFIPKTAKWTAENLKVDNFDITDLFNPDLSIKFSLWYLNRLISMFDGELIYVFASYNSGENAVKKFIENKKPRDLAEFIEMYPYDETRDYVKKVLRNYVIYEALEE